MISFPLMNTYRRFPLCFKKSQGCYLFDEQNEAYLDFASGIAVNALGHGHPAMKKALDQYHDRPWHVSNLYTIKEQIRLGQTLIDNTFAHAAFFCNSGTEANEAGIKIIHKYWSTKNQPQKHRIITAKNAFHGRSLGMISACDRSQYREGFGPLMTHFDFVPFNDIAGIKNAICQKTAAILIEPIQGEAGIHIPDENYLSELKNIAHKHDILLMFDEIQSGVGRTGKLFAHEHTQVTPDIMTCAKGLGGGFPIGACLTGEKTSCILTPGSHGTTFGGNPLACHMAQTVLENILQPGFLDHVQKQGQSFYHGLMDLSKKYPQAIIDIRAKGLMVGLQSRFNNQLFVKTLHKYHLLSVPAGDNVVRFLPPLIVQNEHIQQALESIDQCICELSSQNNNS